MKNSIIVLRSSLSLVLVMTLLLGAIYPMLVTGVAQIVFPYQASGSLIERDGRVIGSELLGQSFENEWYFWSRPSATVPPYNPSASGGSNLAVTNQVFLAKMAERIAAFQRVDPENTKRIPIDLVTASASGLDPHISLAAAVYQVPRVAKARALDEKVIKKLIYAQTESFGYGRLTTPYVNVLKLNIALDDLAKQSHKK